MVYLGGELTTLKAGDHVVFEEEGQRIRMLRNRQQLFRMDTHGFVEHVDTMDSLMKLLAATHNLSFSRELLIGAVAYEMTAP
jgi:phage gp45-like